MPPNASNVAWDSPHPDSIEWDDPKPKTSQALGFEQSVGNFIANAAQPAVWLGKALGLDKQVQQIQKEQEFTRNPAHDPNVQPGAFGKFAGNLPAYVGTTFMGPIAGGLTAGALTSESKTPGGVAGDMLKSAAFNKGGDMLMSGAQRLLMPTVSKAAKSLLDAKIPLTMGQTAGGLLKDVEDKMTSWPVVGTAIKSAQGRATEGLNRAGYNRALAPVGETLPDSVPTGREAVDYVGSKIGEKYDDALAGLTAKHDPQFVSEMQSIIDEAKNKLPNQQYGQFKKIIEGQISGKVSNGGFDSDALQSINSELGRRGSGYSADPSFDNRELGDLVGRVRSSFMDMVKRSNPDKAGALKAADTAWANFVRVRRAASAVGAKDGVYSAPQFSNAVRASDKSAGKGAYARGDALMQDLSDPALKTLSSGTPDSGTAGRLLLLDAFRNPAMALPGLAAGAVYSSPVQSLARTLLSGERPAWAPAAAAAIGRMRKPTGLLGAASAQSLIGSQD